MLRVAAESAPQRLQFDQSEVRRLADEFKREASLLWRRLVQLYDGGAHTVLGYLSWHKYCADEFGLGRSHCYRLVDAGRVAEVVPQMGNEAQARGSSSSTRLSAR
jgi:hypothetical protein